MPDITDEEYAELNRLRSEGTTKDLDLAKANFRAENPHIPVTFLETWQGDPADLPKFGETLLAQFPKPVTTPPPAATAEGAPPAAVVAPAAPAAPGVPQMVVPPAPIPGVSAPAAAPVVAQPLTPEAYRQEYERAAAQGRPLQTLEQMQNQARPVPAPGIGDALTTQNANAQQSETIRERMRIGAATPSEVQWLAQNGDKGFVAAMTQHARKVQVAVGGRT